MNGGFWIAIWLVVNLGAVGIYDVVVYWCLQASEESVSYWLQTWMRDWPMLGVAVGIIIGHLAWPLHVLRRGANDGHG